MKISNWRRKLAAALVAGGSLSPLALTAAPLNTNLILNPGFENVDLGSTSYYNAPQILNWDGFVPGFAYSHDFETTGVAGFANGGALAGGGLWYFTPGNSLIHTFQDALFQDIDVSTGDTASAIAAGTAQFQLSGFFSTYGGQADRAFVQADFYNGEGGVIGTAQISTPLSLVLSDWTQFSATGALPVGTALVQISTWGEPAEGSADGYQDNLDFRIVQGGFAADFDGNGVVDGGDVVVWQRGLGIASGATKSQGNADGDGDVDANDLGIWRSQFGSGAVIAAGAAPEPGSLAIAAAGFASLAAIRRRSR